jgi:protocatechuate 3,4-dioxygenase beta subunit
MWCCFSCVLPKGLNRYMTKYSLVSFILILTTLSASCSSTGYDKKDSLGAIYGSVGLLAPEDERKGVRPTGPGPASINPEGTHILIKETGHATTADKKGHFHFSKLTPGEYTLVANYEEGGEAVHTGIEVRGDSITFAPRIILPQEPGSRDTTAWSGTRIQRVDMSRRGNIKGQISKCAPGATISVRGTVWSARADSAGRYRISGVLPGEYEAISYNQMDANTPCSSKLVYGIQVISDRTAIVDFSLSGPLSLPTPPPSVPDKRARKKWEKQYASN